MKYTKPLHLTMIKKYQALNPGISDDQAITLWKADMAKIGSKGGKNGRTGGFAISHEHAVASGRKGGLKSRKPKSVIK